MKISAHRYNLFKCKPLLRLLGLVLFCNSFPILKAQFVNGDFSQGALSCYAPTYWQSNNDVQIADYFQPGNQWLDITGCSFGNGNWIEQDVHTTPGVFYRISLDLGTWWGWGVEDAGVDISIDGVKMPARYYNDSFTKTFTINLQWATITTCEFMAKSTTTRIRFTGHGLCSKFSPPSACTNPDPGVIAIDNIHFSDSFSLFTDSAICFNADGTKLKFNYTGKAGSYIATWLKDNQVAGTGDTITVYSSGSYKLEFSTACQTISRDIIVGNLSIVHEHVSLCAGDSIMIGSKYYSKPGNYDRVIKNPGHCDSMVTVRLSILSPGLASFSDSICLKDTLFFMGKKYTGSGIYRDTIDNYLGCDSIVELTLFNKKGPECQCGIMEKIPNVFSPNADNMNEYFPDRQVNGMKIWIYDRWGMLVFHSGDGKGWNGEFNGIKIATGTYYYLMEFDDCTEKGQKTHGVLSLVR